MTQGTLEKKSKSAKSFAFKAAGHENVASLVSALKARGIEIHRTAQARLDKSDLHLHKSGAEVSLHFSSPSELGFKNRPGSLSIVRDEMTESRRVLAREEDVEAFVFYESQPEEQVFLMTSANEVFALDHGSIGKPTLYYLSVQAGCDHGCRYADRGIKSS